MTILISNNSIQIGDFAITEASDGIAKQAAVLHQEIARYKV